MKEKTNVFLVIESFVCSTRCSSPSGRLKTSPASEKDKKQHNLRNAGNFTEREMGMFCALGTLSPLQVK